MGIFSNINFGDVLSTGISSALGGVPGAVLSGLGSLVSSIFGDGKSKKQQERNFQYAIKLADYQNGINIANWNLNNEWNNPSNQLKRLKEANLNPNLGYSGIAGNTANPVTVSQPHMNQLDPMAMASYQMQLQQMYQQNMLTAAQTKKVATETEGQETENALKSLAYAREKANEPYYEQIAEWNKDVLMFKVQNLGFETYQKELDTTMKKLDSYMKLYLYGEYPDSIKEDSSDDEDTATKKADARKQFDEKWEDFFSNSTLGQSKSAELRTPIQKYEYMHNQIRVIEEELKLYPAKLKKLNAEAAYEELRLSLARQGINITDPMWARVLGQILNELFPEGAIQEGVRRLRNFNWDDILPW